jgi:hypothetical protein
MWSVAARRTQSTWRRVRIPPNLLSSNVSFKRYPKVIPVSRELTKPADKAGPIENGVAQAGSALKCNAFLCRGYQYEDNTATEYKPGQVVDFHIDLIAGHHPGYAVSCSTDWTFQAYVG